ncbi:MAG: 4Fe-4S binding protein [Candidatus Bathyarchaeia archaeon]
MLSRKHIRYLRWIIKGVFLLIFISPIYSISSQLIQIKSAILNRLLIAIPIGQSPDSIWLGYYGNIRPGFWIMEPFGGLQVLMTGLVDSKLILSTLIAISIFLLLIVLFGNIFCSWLCPLGTIIDSFDWLIRRLSPKIEDRRERKMLKSGNDAVYCRKYPLYVICPLGRISKDDRLLAKLLMTSSLAITPFLKFPVFCVICPIGIISKGMLHLKGIKTALHIGGKELFLWIEMLLIPLVAVLLSVIERRYWCKHLCPVGFFLNVIATLNPFIKPKVQKDKCIIYACPPECNDAYIEYCGVCRLVDAKKCEKVCPANIKLTSNGSLFGCTKCMECYATCEYEAVVMEWMTTSDVKKLVKKLYRRLCKIRANPEKQY